MSDIKDLGTTYRVTETSFGGADGDPFALVSADPTPTDEREETQQRLSSSADAPLKARQPGLITRIGRGVKSAVGGAIGAINNFVGNFSICLCLIMLLYL